MIAAPPQPGKCGEWLLESRPTMSKKLLFTALTALIVVAICALLVALALPVLKSRLRDQLVQTVAWTLTEEEREVLYRQAADAGKGIWDVVPDPLVARVAKRGIKTTRAGAEVRINNAGFRSSKPFKKKEPGRFRIICLGDSFVFGQGGPEEDRFCDQIEAFYRDQGITVEGKTIETYAIGIGGWTAVQEATYLSTRISSYEADVVLVLTVANDITDSYGVTGAGTTTRAFSPEHRDWGSAFFSEKAGAAFGTLKQAALTTDICPEARDRWRKAMLALRRLSEVQTRRSGKILNSVSIGPGPRARYFVETYKRFYKLHGPETPFVVTSYFRSEETKLAHDSHPNRRGHAIYANHYIHMLDRLGWLPVPEGRLPPLDRRLSLEIDPAQDHEQQRRYRREVIRRLRPVLDFTRLEQLDMLAFLGGIMPDEIGARALDAPPWASVRSGFLLRFKNTRTAARVAVEIDVPPRPELFPFRVEMSINGRLAETFDFAEPNATGGYTLETVVEAPGEVVEVLLRTDSYFCEIDDHRMKSFQLISAEARKAS